MNVTTTDERDAIIGLLRTRLLDFDRRVKAWAGKEPMAVLTEILTARTELDAVGDSLTDLVVELRVAARDASRRAAAAELEAGTSRLGVDRGAA
jgi:hypothetical protein